MARGCRSLERQFRAKSEVDGSGGEVEVAAGVPCAQQAGQAASEDADGAVDGDLKRNKACAQDNNWKARLPSRSR
jgi:hypothetical protein